MDRLEHALLAAAVTISHALAPATTALTRLHFYFRLQMTFFGIPLSWHDGILVVLWLVVLFMVFRLLTGWLRLMMVLCTLLIVAKMWGYLPA